MHTQNRIIPFLPQRSAAWAKDGFMVTLKILMQVLNQTDLVESPRSAAVD